MHPDWCCGTVGKATTCNADIPCGLVLVTPLTIHVPVNFPKKVAEDSLDIWTPAPYVEQPGEAAGFYLQPGPVLEYAVI